MRWLDNFAGNVYLSLLVATDFPEQEPEYELARWYDLLWLLIPIVGILVFIPAIGARRFPEDKAPK